MNHAETFNALTIQRQPDGSLVLTAPDLLGNAGTIIKLHQAQARRIGEMAGMRDTDHAERELTNLRRRVRTIDWHASRLSDWLRDLSDRETDLHAECLMAVALADMTGGAVAEFPMTPEAE